MILNVDPRQLEIKELIIQDSDLSSILLDIPEEDREEIIRKALKIGLVALKGASTTEKVDYIEKEFNKLKVNVEDSMRTTDESIKNNLEKVFSDKGLLKSALEDYLGEGGKLKDLFDEKQKDSAIGKISEIMSKHFDGDGSVVKKLLDSNNPDSPLYLLKKDLMDTLKNIETSVTVKAKTEELLSKTPQKGFDYQALVAYEVDKIARILEDNVVDVGSTQGNTIKSKKGDIISKVNPKNTNGKEIELVFEAKDEKLSLGSTLIQLDSAKTNRGADAAIMVFSSIENSPNECGTFRVYDKERIVCVLDKDSIDPTMLQAAYKVAIALAYIRRVKDEKIDEAVDIDRIMSNVNGIREKIKTFSNIKTSLTSVNTYIGNVQSTLDILKTDLIRHASDIELAMASDTSKVLGSDRIISDAVVENISS